MMILPLLLMALPPDYSPEAAAVMDRSRREAAKRRATEASARESTAAVAAANQRVGDGPIPVPPEIAGRFTACIDQANSDPQAALTAAASWQGQGGTYFAQQCQGYAYAKLQRWAPAALAFEQGAGAAEVARDPAAGRLWAQAGNAALAGGDTAKAKTAFDAALAAGLPDGLVKGEAYLDRARVLVALGDFAGARADLDQATVHAAADPLAWLLSATLARRMGQLKLASAHIAEAVKRSPDDASVALEQGNIAIMAGDDAGAESAWKRAYKLAPETPQGKAADANLSELTAKRMEAEKPAPVTPATPSPAKR